MAIWLRRAVSRDLVRHCAFFGAFALLTLQGQAQVILGYDPDSQQEAEKVVKQWAELAGETSLKNAIEMGECCVFYGKLADGYVAASVPDEVWQGDCDAIILRREAGPVLNGCGAIHEWEHLEMEHVPCTEESTEQEKKVCACNEKAGHCRVVRAYKKFQEEHPSTSGPFWIHCSVRDRILLDVIWECHFCEHGFGFIGPPSPFPLCPDGEGGFCDANEMECSE